MGGTCLGDAQVQGIVRPLAEHLIGLHIHRHIRTFDGDADVVKITVVQKTHMAQGALHQRLRRDAAVFGQQVLFQ